MFFIISLKVTSPGTINNDQGAITLDPFFICTRIIILMLSSRQRNFITVYPYNYHIQSSKTKCEDLSTCI